MSRRKRKRIPDLLQAAHNTANWDKVVGTYKQLVDIVRPSTSYTLGDDSAVHLPEDVADKFALAMSEVRESYIGREQECAEHAIAVCGNVDEKEWYETAVEGYDDPIFRQISNHAAWSSMGQWRPTPIETTVETLRRWRDLTRLRHALANAQCSLALGGSLSYGAFYNVHGNREGKPGSDLDIVFIGSSKEILMAVEQISNIEGADRSSVDRLGQRAAKFLSEFDDDNTILSHKVSMWTSEQDPMLGGISVESQYQISLHFLTDPVLAHVLVEQSAELRAKISGRTRTVRVFRDTRTTRQDHLRTFAGRNHYSPAPLQACELGFMRKTRVYFIDGEDHYCPGQMQSHLMTSRELAYDNLDVRSRLDRLRAKLWERLELERAQAPHEDLKMSLADVRRERFAPNVIRAIDEDPRRGR
jgi:hypothetical protein